MNVLIYLYETEYYFLQPFFFYYKVKNATQMPSILQQETYITFFSSSTKGENVHMSQFFHLVQKVKNVFEIHF